MSFENQVCRAVLLGSKSKVTMDTPPAYIDLLRNGHPAGRFQASAKR